VLTRFGPHSIAGRWESPVKNADKNTLAVRAQIQERGLSVSTNRRAIRSIDRLIGNMIPEVSDTPSSFDHSIAASRQKLRLIADMKANFRSV
jgi:hypothetical protein